MVNKKKTWPFKTNNTFGFYIAKNLSRRKGINENIHVKVHMVLLRVA